MASDNASGDVRDHLAALNPQVRPLARSLHKIFVDAGCEAYVKTIYVGYDIGGEMVAAVYGHSDRLEIALALDENRAHPLLVDASHLTWRTLPVAAILRQKTEIEDLRELVAEGVARIQAGTHDVNRDNDFFVKSRKARRRTGRGS